MFHLLIIVQGNKIGNTCLEGLNHIVAFVCSHLPGKVTQMLENLGKCLKRVVFDTLKLQQYSL